MVLDKVDLAGIVIINGYQRMEYTLSRDFASKFSYLPPPPSRHGPAQSSQAPKFGYRPLGTTTSGIDTSVNREMVVTIPPFNIPYIFINCNVVKMAFLFNLYRSYFRDLHSVLNHNDIMIYIELITDEELR